MSAMSYRITRLVALILTLSVMVGITSADDPTVGTINPATSITGENTGDRIGNGGVYILPSGNVVISSPQWGGNIGAVTCLTPAEYRTGGITVNSSNSLTGDSNEDNVGSTILVLATGDYLVGSHLWDNDGNINIGAVTWVNGDTCIPYGETNRGTTVKPSNSMIGSTISDAVGSNLYKLPNGNYLIATRSWNNGANTQTGALTWCSGVTPCVGVVSPSNSLVGSSINENVGESVTILSDGNYVVGSSKWNGLRGAATWCHRNTGCVGQISAANSLVGSVAGSNVGQLVFSLPNGGYVVESNNWRDESDTKLGAITWCSNTGCKGTVSASNSLVGSTLNDSGVGSALRTNILANGNYIVLSPAWDNDGIVDAGAVTWCSRTSGCKGVISAANSMVGSSAGDGLRNRFYLGATGNYMIANPAWDDGALTDVGAVRLCNGTNPCVGTMTAANSLIGGTASDEIGSTVIALTNGNFVISSPKWDNPTGGIINAGAATFIHGVHGLIGTVSATNSLIGEQSGDQVGNGLRALTNGHYVVGSLLWDHGATVNAGAATWGNGQTGITGVVSPTNSMIGTHANDTIGATYALNNGHYFIFAPQWNSLGAITWCDGTQACVGEVGTINSLVGKTAADFDEVLLVGSLPNGNQGLLVRSWDNGIIPNAGAFIVFSGVGDTVGEINSNNAIVGAHMHDFSAHNFTILPNSDIILNLGKWDSDSVIDAGAIIRVSGTGSTTGEISTANALVGSSGNEFTVTLFTTNPDNSFFIAIPTWNDNRGVVIYSAGPDNLLSNASFETGTAKSLTSWKLSQSAVTADKRLCDKPAKPITRTAGSCVFQFNSTSTPAKARTLKQTISNPVWGTAGNILTLTADVEGVKVGTGAKKIILNIKYDNNTTDRATLTIPAGTYDFTTFTGTVKLTRPVKSVTVTINVGTAKGRIRIDNLFLSAAPAPVLRFPLSGENMTRNGASPFELPAAPDGFRN